MEKHLILSRIETPDGTVLTSTHQHDFKMYLDTVSNEQYILDGGNSYQRTSINKVPFKDLSVYNTDPHEIVREALTWGSYGVYGNEEMVVKPISKLSTEHIKAILRTQTQLKEHIKEIFNNELEYRSMAEVQDSDWIE